MVQPLASILCITYNQKDFIAQTIEGFLMQKVNFPIEIIIHDDASTDGTADIVRKYEAEHPDLIKGIYQTENQHSKRISIWNNFIYPIAKGKYFAECEGDDYWIDPDKLQTQVDFLESHPDYSLTFHDAEIKNEPGVEPVDSVYPKMEDRDYSATEIFQKWVIPTASIVYNRKVLDYPIKNRLNILNGDIVLMERCAHVGKVRCFNKKMSVYRRQPNGMTWNNTNQIKRLMKYPAHYMELKRNFPKIDSKVINRAICHTMVNAWEYIDLKTKIYYFFKGITLAPRTFLRNLIKKILKKNA